MAMDKASIASSQNQRSWGTVPSTPCPERLEISRSLSSYSATSLYPPSTTPPNNSVTDTPAKRSRGRPKTVASTDVGDQHIICAISESRGTTPVISDNQTYTKTEQKIAVYEPSEILFMSTAVQPQKSKLYLLIENNLPAITIVPLDRKYWTEPTGVDYLENLAIRQDLEAIKVPLDGTYHATCCFAAALKFIELTLSITLPPHSLRIKYEPSEDSMMIDATTRRSLELIENLQESRSKDSLYGILNHTLTSMGKRRLRINMLQPSTNRELLERRYDALDELTTKEDVFYAVRQALKCFVDADRVLTAINTIPREVTISYLEQSVNHVIMFKQLVKTVPSICEALAGTRCELLRSIYELCASSAVSDAQELIDTAVNEDITYQTKPLDLRNQRTYAIKSGVNGLLDVARQAYKEANADVYQLVEDLGDAYELPLDLKFDNGRQFYLRIHSTALEDRDLPKIFINVVQRKQFFECQTLDMVKMNQRISDAHFEVLQMTDQSVRYLTGQIREDISPFFKISEAVALLDMLSAFAHVITTQDYVRPELTDTLAIKAGRHPIMEQMRSESFVANDVYATQQTRFQIITGSNMSGKSTYTRSLALMTIMAQIGCFVPATYASFPIRHQLFLRAASDNSSTAGISTFGAEMRETAFILRNADERSLVIIDELGRGTSTVDGISIAIAVAEALVDSKALVWFVTHFQELAKALEQRPGVTNLHLAVHMRNQGQQMTALYQVASGYEAEDNYGMTLAKMVGLPADIIEVAEDVSRSIKERNERMKPDARNAIVARRKKLVLGLYEQLKQAQTGNMSGRPLANWLSELQKDFIKRMVVLDDEEAEAGSRSVSMETEASTMDSISLCEDGISQFLRVASQTPDTESQAFSNGSQSDDGRSCVQSLIAASRVDSTSTASPRSAY